MDNLPICYNVRPVKGKCIIFNNEKFSQLSGFKDRNGTNKDAENLKSLFSDIGYTVERYDNLDADDIKKTLTAESKISHEDESSFICVILSHGESGIIYGSDCRPLHMEDILETMKGLNCPSLVGKPKIFLVQSCYEDAGIEVSDAVAAAAEGDHEEYSIPAEADVLYANSMIPGHLTWNKGKSGSTFIDNICKVFRQFQGKDILWLLTRVNYEIAIQNEQLLSNAIHDVPQIVSMLTKDFTFK